MTKKNQQIKKNTRSELEHFVNDVKYVTLNLQTDRRAVLQRFHQDIFEIDPTQIKERFALEYEPFFQMIHSKLHTEQAPITGPQLRNLLREYEITLKTLHEQLSVMSGLMSDMKNQFGICIGESFGQFKKIKKLTVNLNKDMIPAQSWLFTDNYDKICSWINEAQTMAEDEIRARKRILKVWKEEILQPEYEAVIDSFLKHNDTGFKIFQGSYWSERKKLRSMFIEDISLLNDNEYKVLWTNLKLLKNSENWRKENDDTLKLVIGNAYCGLDTEFEVIRRQYETIYSIVEASNEWTKNTTIVDTKKQLQLRETLSEVQGFDAFYELCQRMNNLVPELYQQLLNQCFPWFGEQDADEYSVATIYDVISESNAVISHLKTDYYLIYEKLKSEKEDLTIDQIRKTIYRVERIHQKQDWLHKNEDKITKLIGPLETLRTVDWEQVRRQVCKLEASSQEQTPEVVFESYVPLGQEAVNELLAKADTDSDIAVGSHSETTMQAGAGSYPEIIIRAIIEAEQPLHLNLLLKRAVSFLGLSRVTKSLKEQAASVITAVKEQGYSYENEFLWCGDVKSIRFRKNGLESAKRELSLIAPIELKAGIYKMIKTCGELKTEEISKQIANLLGIPRRNQSFNTQIEQAVFSLKRENLIVRHSGGWRIMSE